VVGPGRSGVASPDVRGAHPKRVIRRRGLTHDALEEPDPLHAIESVLARQEFDEIILSTLPKHVSAWLHIDLPRRVARKFQGPVTHVETDHPSPSPNDRGQ
jgi:hypothetical protein